MKTLIIGAAGLLLSSTALAAVITKDMDDGMAAAPVAAKDADGLGSSLIGNAITIDWPAKRADARAIDTKHIVTAAKAPMQPEAAAAETPSTSEMSDTLAPVDETGVGGPDEEEVAATAAATPVTTQTSWPACSPGPGDDNCIQLYEPGVGEAYAAWQANGGLPGTAQSAMGGPEEPVEGAAVVPAAVSDPVCQNRAGDGCIQPGETETLASVDGSERLAMGGPDEPAEGDELAAYEPLPEDAVMPAAEDSADKDSPDTMAI
jgi:hypothetical protein